MAQVNFNDVDFSAGNNFSGPGFFSLKNDGDEAIVRILHDSVTSFDIMTVHNVKVGDKFRKVNCIRDPHAPLEDCPLCQANVPVQQRFFIHMLQYIPNTSTGTVEVKPVVWERAVKYANTLKSYIDNYGPLSEIVCKIIRHGRSGDMQTTYEIVPNLSKSIYRDDVYVKDVHAFDNYNVLGTVVMDKNFADIKCFLTTGSFPEVASEERPEVTVPNTPNQYVYSNMTNSSSSSIPYSSNSEAPVYNNFNQPVIDRPTRYY